jgi:acyl-coenzyme A synthetase/AMP-(fatty) acid ligase
MRKPFGAVRIQPETLSRTELKTYLKVLQDQNMWNSSLKYFISTGEIIPEQEIERVKELLNKGGENVLY